MFQRDQITVFPELIFAINNKSLFLYYFHGTIILRLKYSNVTASRNSFLTWEKLATIIQSFFCAETTNALQNHHIFHNTYLLVPEVFLLTALVLILLPLFLLWLFHFRVHLLTFHCQIRHFLVFWLLGKPHE